MHSPRPAYQNTPASNRFPIGTWKQGTTSGYRRAWATLMASSRCLGANGAVNEGLDGDCPGESKSRTLAVAACCFILDHPASSSHSAIALSVSLLNQHG